MILLCGQVTPGYGVAEPNLKHLEKLIAERCGLPQIVTGTLNVRLSESYFVKPDHEVSAREYNGSEVIWLQRAVISGIPALVMRPHTHELSESFGHGTTTLELLAPLYLRDHLSLVNGSDVQVELEGDEAWWNSARGAI